MITVTDCMMGAPNYFSIICIRKQHSNHMEEIHLSVFCRTNSPSIDQSRAEGNNTECVGKKRFNGSVTNGLRKEHMLRPPFLDKVLDHICFSYGYL